MAAAPPDRIASPFVIGTFSRPADLVSGGLNATTTWALITGSNGYGKQATVDIPGENFVGGLRIKIGRAGLAADASNGVVATTSLHTSTSASLSVANKTITIRWSSTARLAQVKQVVDAAANLTSVYYGGADGTARGQVGTFTSEGGIEDQWAAARIRVQNDLWVQTGIAAPTDLAGAILLRSQHPTDLMVAPSQSVYQRSRTATVAFSIEVWRAAGTE